MEKPRFEIAQNLAWDALTEHTDGTFPINLYGTISTIPDLKIKTYSEWADELLRRKEVLELGLTNRQQLIDCLGSNDSVLIANHTDNIILYDETKEITQCRWNVAHELGHYFLGHGGSFGHGGSESYEVQEKEANYFARQLLTPIPIVTKIIKSGESFNDISSLADFFWVSYSVMNYTIDNIRKMPFYIMSLELENKFGPFIADMLTGRKKIS